MRRVAAVLVFFPLLTAALSAQTPLTCVAQAAGTPSLRAEGHYEPLGDIIIVCNGGAPSNGVRFVGLEVSIFPDRVPLTSRTLDPVALMFCASTSRSASTIPALAFTVMLPVPEAVSLPSVMLPAKASIR